MGDSKRADQNKQGGVGVTQVEQARRPPIRGRSIARFCDEVREYYETAYEKKSTGKTWTYHGVNRALEFISRHPSAKTTADLKTSLVHEYAANLAGLNLKESTRVMYLKYLRSICGLAVKWRCLKRNPFEEYRLPTDADRTEAPEPKGRKLDEEQVRRILAYLKARCDTWSGHRLYALVSLVVYAGLNAAEALNMKRGDCELDRRLIRVPRRTKAPHLKPTNLVEISQDLVDILTSWFPKTECPPAKWNGRTRFGEKRSEDGKGIVPDAAQLKTLEDMKRWRGEGWTYKRIAEEMDAQGVPRKFGGARWHASNVHMILKRVARTEPADRRAPEETGDKPDWVFPTMVGKGRWTHRSGTVYTALQQIRDMGKDLGIEGLTIESLRRYYHDHKRIVLEIGRNEPNTATAGQTTQGNPQRCSVILTGPGTTVEVLHVRKTISPKRLHIITRLVNAGPDGLKVAQLNAKFGDGVGTLGRMRADDKVWEKAILPPDKKNGLKWRLAYSDSY